MLALLDTNDYSLGMKACNRCGEEKTLEEFSKDKSKKDGLNTACKSCRSASAKVYYKKNCDNIKKRTAAYRLENPEWYREYNKRAWKDTKEDSLKLEAQRIRVREYVRRPEVKSKRRETGREYKQRPYVKAKMAAYQAARVKERPDLYRNYARKYRARKNSAEGNFTDEEFRDLCKSYDNKCLCCGKQRRLAADHVVPLVKGGDNTIENIQPLCKSCNSSKKDKIIDYRR